MLHNRKGRPRARAPSYACTTFINAARRTESGRDRLARFLLALRERPDVLKVGQVKNGLWKAWHGRVARAAGVWTAGARHLGSW